MTDSVNDRERTILQHLASGPTSVTPLLAQVGKGSLYRVLGRLRDRGLVAPGQGDGTWQLTPAGERALTPASTRLDPGAPASGPSLPLPQLDLMPSAEHRALAELVVLSAAARRHYEQHHASYVAFSATGLRGKTWLAEACARILGVDPLACILHAGAERGAGLTARRKGTGEIAAVRSALSGPLLAIDEWRRGSKEVRRASELLIHGHRTVPLEEERLEVASVVMLLMNSPAEAKTPEEATGLGPAMIRRCFPADLSQIELDAAFARDGEERLDRLTQLDPVTFPESRDVDERALRDMIADVLPQVLDSEERMASLDLVLLGQLAAVTSWFGLAPADAVRLVLTDAATVWSTVGWTREGWRDRLARRIPGSSANQRRHACRGRPERDL